MAGMAFLTLGLNLFAQPAMDWFVNFGSYYPSGYSEIYRLHRSQTNDLYAHVQFQTAPYHPDPANPGQTIAEYGYTTLITKFDADNNYQWANPLYFTGQHNYQLEITGMTTDASGNLYICGTAPQEFDADPGPAVQLVTPLSPGSNDYSFVLKYSASGTFLWKAGFDEINLKGIAIAPSGNVCLVGGAGVAWVDFDPGAAVYSGVAFGGFDAFVLELTSDGNFADLTVMGGTAHEIASLITFDSNDNMYVAGHFYSSAGGQSSQFDPAGNGNAYTTVTINAYDAFLVKINSNGNYQWSQAIQSQSGTGYTYITGAPENLLINSQNEVLLSFGFNGDFLLDFNGSSVGSATQGIAFTSFDNSGSQLYGKFIETTSSWSPQISLASNDEIIFSTGFASNIDVEPGPGITTLSAPFFGAGAALVRYDTQMNVLWSGVIDGAFNSHIQATSNDEIYLSAGCNEVVDPDLSSNSAQTNPANGTCLLINYYECAGIDQSVISNGIILTAAQSGGTYQWVDCNNSNAPISGATSQTFTPANGGDYACQITIGSCTYLSDCANSVAGLDEMTGTGFRVYPNPSSGMIQVELPEGYSGAVQVVDILGRVVFEAAHVTEPLQLNLTSGEYILRGNSDAGLPNQKITVL
jgi:hypothetical protein